MAKKYYWLKLKKDFFKRHDIRIIEEMPNGKEYVLLYLKLLTESISHDGNLRFNDTIPYDEKMIATITNTNIDIVRAAMGIFEQLHLVEILDDKTIYMAEVEKMVGSETEWAKKKRIYRQKQGQLEDKERTLKDNVRQEIELEIDIDIDKEKSKKYKYSPQQMEFAELLFSEIKKNNPNHKKPNLKNWANTFRLMQDRDNRKDEDITKVIYWCQQDDFWYKNILSADKLRKQFDKLYIQMGDKQKKKSNSFNDFNQRNYSKNDMAELEKKLLGGKNEKHRQSN